MGTLPDTIAARVVVLDGGLATELERRGYDLSSAQWSARLLHDEPDAIESVHRGYFAAGAEVATTASYQVSFEAFGDDTTAMLHRSVELARRARDAHGAGWVAASVGPYGAVLADGSEYRGDYSMDVTALRRFHRPRLEILGAAGADVLAVETIPCLAEVEALVTELASLDVPAWVSFTSVGGRTRAGEPLADAFAMAGECAPVVAVGVNCLAPSEVTPAVAVAVATTGKPAVAYPNSGEAWDAARGAWSGASSFAGADVRDWVSAGARLVGGCCRVGPDEIAELARLVPFSSALGPFPYSGL